MVEKKPTVFVRRASGFVREFTQLHALGWNWIWPMNTTLYMMPLYIAWLSPLFIGANIPLGAIIAVLMALGPIIAYSMMGAAMPRSGGDYVWSSRIIHPVVGVVASIGYAVYFFGWLTFNGIIMASFILQGPLTLVGMLTNNAGLISFAAWCGGDGFMLIVLLTVVLPILPLLGGMKRFGHFVMLTTVALVIATGLAMYSVIVPSQTAFIQGFNNLMGSGAYQNFINEATAAGWTGTASFVGPLLPWDTLVLGVTFLGTQLIWSWPSVILFGEIKRAESLKMNFLVMLIPCIFFLATAPLYIVSSINLIGPEFSSAVYYLGNAGGPLVANLPFSWDTTLIWMPFIALGDLAVPMILITDFLLAISVFYSNSGNVIMPVRYFFNMAFDRVLPKGFAYVEQRYHTPLVGYIAMAIGGTIWTVLTYLYPGVWGYISAVIAANCLLFLVGCLAATMFPYRMKDVYKASPASKYGPLLVIAGIVGVFSMALTMGVYLGVPTLGGTVNVPTLVAVWIGGAVIYYIAKVYRKATEGIDISLAFKEIPPE